MNLFSIFLLFLFLSILADKFLESLRCEDCRKIDRELYSKDVGILFIIESPKG